MSTLPYTLTQADLEFHSSMMLEHTIFLHLAIEEEPFKTQSFEQYQQWRQYVEQGYPELQLSSLVEQLRTLKTGILEQLLSGRWVGWLSISFMRYILEELDEFALKISGQRPTVAIMALQSWRLMIDHLEDAESKIDPIETYFKQQARELLTSMPQTMRRLAHRSYNSQQLLTDYQEEIGRSSDDVQWIIGSALKAGEDIDKFLDSIEKYKPKTTIHPLLLTHWRKEGHYRLQELAVASVEILGRNDLSPLG